MKTVWTEKNCKYRFDVLFFSRISDVIAKHMN